MKYKNKKTGKVVEVKDWDEKLGVTVVQYEDGSLETIAFTRLAKRWEKLNTPLKEISLPEEKIQVCEIKELQKGKKDMEEKVQKTKFEKSQEVFEIMEYIKAYCADHDIILFTPQKSNHMKSLKYNGHMIMNVSSSLSRITLRCRGKAVGENVVPDKKVNHIFDQLYYISSLTEEEKNKINSLIEMSLNYEKAKGKGE